MELSFTKIHGLGNDYIYFNALKNAHLLGYIQPSIVDLCDRHFGIGADGVIVIESSDIADCKMRMFNNNGLEGQMCGNGIRGVAKLLWDKHIITKNPLCIETLAGIKSIYLRLDASNKMIEASVNMGELDFDPAHVPFCSQDNRKNNEIYIFDYLYQNESLCFYVGSIGSKHAVCFLEKDVDTIDFCKIGKDIELNQALFPERVNVEFVNIISSSKLKMRVWERGSGHTLACGTGASFVAGVSMKLGLVDSSQEIEVEFEKGSVTIKKQENSIILTGPSELVFDGIINL